MPASAALLSLFVFAVSTSSVPAALLRAAAEFEIAPELLATVSAVQFTGFVLATLFGGIAADIVGKKGLLAAACVCTVAGAGTWSVSGSLGAVYAGSFVMGMGGGVLEGMSSALLADLFPDRRKFFLNLSQAVFCVGAVSAPVLMGWLIPAGVSWRVFFAGLCCAALVLLLLYLAARIPAPAAEERITRSALKGLARRSSFLVPCLVVMLYVVSETSVAVFANTYLRTRLHAPENWAIYAIALFWMSMAVGRLLCAMIPERVSYEKVTAALLLVSGLALACQGVVRTWEWSLAFFSLTGFLMSGIWPMVVGLNVKRHPRYTGTVLGVTVAAGAVGCVAAPPILSALLAAGLTGGAFVLAALPLFVGAAVVLVQGRADVSP